MNIVGLGGVVPGSKKRGLLMEPTQMKPTQPLLTLVSLNYSPFSERARWALDHHQLRYVTRRHDPFIGELRLRRLLRQGVVSPQARQNAATNQRATVPVLLTPEGMLTDSWDIVQYADGIGNAERLIPSVLETKIRELMDIANVAMDQGRVLVVHGMLANPESLDESLPQAVPQRIRPLLRPITGYGTRWFAKKYGIPASASAAGSSEQVEKARELVRGALLQYRERLAGNRYFLGRFSYADIVIATALQGVSPVADHFIPLGPGARKAWTKPDLAGEFADLLAWRDALYAAHRVSSAGEDVSQSGGASAAASV
jgi:glutathione S-transferase